MEKEKEEYQGARRKRGRINLYKKIYKGLIS